MPALRIPIGRPNLLVAGRHRAFVANVSTVVRLFAASRFAHRIQVEEGLTLEAEEDVADALEALRVSALFNTMCILEWESACYSGDGIGWTEEVTGLVLRFPEVYWLFVVPASTVEKCKQNHPELSWHFASLEEPTAILIAAARHLFGFRTCFDPTGLQEVCVHAVKQAERESVKWHSAPFFLQAVASTLIARAERLTREAAAPATAVYGAALATYAYQLLGGRTLASSLQALRLMHRLEVTAECAFVGTASSLPVQARLNEVQVQLAQMVRLVGGRDAGSHVRGVEPNLVRRGLAIAVDEEEDFALVHAYILFSHGFRALAVMSETSLSDANGLGRIAAVLEDRDLRFPDVSEEETKRLDLLSRSCYYPVLSAAVDSDGRRAAPVRVLVSVDPDLSRVHPAVRALFAGAIAKPHAGVFEPSLFKLLSDASENQQEGSRRRIVEGSGAERCGRATRHVRYQEQSALVKIAEDLRSAYRAFEQFDEEDAVLSEVRAYRRKLHYLDVNARGSWMWRGLRRGMRWYLDTAVSSPLITALFALCWICVFAGAYSVLARVGWATFGMNALEFSGFTFIEMQPAATAKSSGVGVVAVDVVVLGELITAFLHLGLLMASLYQKTSRR
jgi:hypothetical protein